jgi:DNA-binding transcriptional MerR regulator
MAFTASQTARLTGCTAAQLESWDRAGLVSVRPGDDGPYAFRDLVALRTVKSLLDAGLSLARVRRAVAEIARGGDELSGLQLVTDGDRVWACHDDGQILDALRHGQLALFVSVGRVAADVEADVREFSRERQTFVDQLRRGNHPAGSG